MLVNLHQDVREVKQQLSQTASMLQELQGDRRCDYENMDLPVGVHLPAESEDDIIAIEAALDDSDFRKQLVISWVSTLQPEIVCS